LHTKTLISCLLLWVALTPAGCSVDESLPDDARTRAADEQVRRKWNQGLDELPTVTLQVISPHNENIRNEFSWAFSLDHAVAFGQRVHIVWRDAGGGGSSIEKFLLNVYGAGGNPEIDVVWGGGEFPFRNLARKDLLVPMQLPAETLAQIPATIGRQRMIDAKGRWVGSALSGFGFLWNAGMLRRCRIDAPRSWEDLADPRFADLLVLADPNQSGSAAAAYRMIVLSEPTWPEGWAKLLGVLGNAKRFTDSAGSAANAPVLGEALVATAIDFYGAMRVAEAPGEIEYLSPRGQTVFTPDPIAILRDPPNRQLAQRFVDFVLSAKGQALWALAVGEPGGPVRTPLGRQPIRRDVYADCAGRMLPWIVNPYRTGQALVPDAQLDRPFLFGVLRKLVGAAAVDNRTGLRAARRKLIEADFQPQLLERFNALPANVATIDAMAEVAAQLKDDRRRDRILNEWREFFRTKYREIVDAEIERRTK